MKKLIVLITAVFALSVFTFAQPRPMEKTTVAADVKPAPAVVPAKYEGGLLGYNQKETGTLKFDDVNERVVFYGPDQKERFGIPYASLLAVYSSEKSVTTTAGNVIKYIPLPGASLAGLITEKRRYLVLQYDDPDVESKGATSFKLETKEILESVIHALGGKAKLNQRGDAYIRLRPVSTDTN